MCDSETDKYLNKNAELSKMFVVLYVKKGVCYFEVPGIDKYTQVTLVQVESLEAATFIKNAETNKADNTNSSGAEIVDVDDIVDDPE